MITFKTQTFQQNCYTILIANCELVTRICGKFVRTTNTTYFIITNPAYFWESRI